MSIKPGQAITCTVTKVPFAEDDVQTIERLMRRDLVIKRGLAKAARLRSQRMNIFNRGNRDWVSREKTARIARVTPGQAWSMTYTPDLAPDFAKVAKFIKVAAK